MFCNSAFKQGNLDLRCYVNALCKCGPVMFVCYTAPLGDITHQHGINVHLYADDTQLYLTFSPHSDEDTIQAVTHIQDCVAELQEWTNINKLK